MLTEQIWNMNEVVERMNVLFVTLDSLRYDVAAALFSEGGTPNFHQHFPAGWQHCHSPGSFTYAAHQAFFAGFLPTPATNAKAPRLFAARFAGSETTGAHTRVFDTPDIVTGFAEQGFRTICIGGVGCPGAGIAFLLPGKLLDARLWCYRPKQYPPSI